MRRSNFRKSLTAFALVGGLLALTACQSAPEHPIDAGPSCAIAGAASQSITASGEFRTPPEVEFAPGLTTSTTERTVLIKGEGPVAKLGSLVTLDFVAFNARTGELIESTGYGAEGVGRNLVVVDPETTLPGLRRAILCTTAGSRVAAVVPASEGPASFGSSVGLRASDDIVVVFDLLDVARERAKGEAQPAIEGLPTVSNDSEGLPVISIPAVPAPGFTVATLVKGDGLVVREDSALVLKYRGVLWRNGIIFADNWSDPNYTEKRSGDDFLPGFAEALLGQTVGSQILVVVPPVQGYGTGGNSALSITGSDSLVYVIDILAAS